MFAILHILICYSEQNPYRHDTTTSTGDLNHFPGKVYTNSFDISRERCAHVRACARVLLLCISHVNIREAILDTSHRYKGMIEDPSATLLLLSTEQRFLLIPVLNVFGTT